LIVTVVVAVGVSVMASVEFEEHPDHASVQAKLASAKNTRNLDFPTAFLITCRESDGIDAHPLTTATHAGFGSLQSI
jgi:hypothetical protein